MPQPHSMVSFSTAHAHDGPGGKVLEGWILKRTLMRILAALLGLRAFSTHCRTMPGATLVFAGDQLSPELLADAAVRPVLGKALLFLEVLIDLVDLLGDVRKLRTDGGPGYQHLPAHFVELAQVDPCLRRQLQQQVDDLLVGPSQRLSHAADDRTVRTLFADATDAIQRRHGGGCLLGGHAAVGDKLMGHMRLESRDDGPRAGPGGHGDDDQDNEY